MILKVSRGESPLPFNFKVMTIVSNAIKVTSAVLCAGLFGAATCAFVPAAEARSYQNKIRHELRLKQLRRQIRLDNRHHRHARRASHRDVNRYPRVIPVYGLRYGHVYGAPSGFGIQLRF